MWIVFALLAALSAAGVVVLSKAGMKKLDSSLVFAIEAVLILIISWSFVFIRGKQEELSKIETRTWMFLLAAGVLTTVSSLLSFRALKLGDAGAVSPVERLSLVFAIVFATVFLKEKLTWQVIAGATLMAVGAIIIAISKRAS